MNTGSSCTDANDTPTRMGAGLTDPWAISMTVNEENGYGTLTKCFVCRNGAQTITSS